MNDRKTPQELLNDLKKYEKDYKSRSLLSTDINFLKKMTEKLREPKNSTLPEAEINKVRDEVAYEIDPLLKNFAKLKADIQNEINNKQQNSNFVNEVAELAQKASENIQRQKQNQKDQERGAREKEHFRKEKEKQQTSQNKNTTFNKSTAPTQKQLRKTMDTCLKKILNQIQEINRQKQQRVSINDIDSLALNGKLNEIKLQLEKEKKSILSLIKLPKLSSSEVKMHQMETYELIKNVRKNLEKLQEKTEDKHKTRDAHEDLRNFQEKLLEHKRKSKVQHLKNIIMQAFPTTQPAFEVTYGIYADRWHRRILAFMASYPPSLESDTAQETIENAIKIVMGKKAVLIKKYNAIKAYFENKIKQNQLENPLIYFDDNDLRVDVGYGPKEFQALFPEFTYYDGVFAKEILGGATFFGKSPAQSFTPEFFTIQYDTQLKKEMARIMEVAEQEFKKPLPSKTKINLTDPTQETQIVKNCFENNKGLVVGERHEDKTPKQFLIDNMELFKAQGVTALYMEHLLHETHQAMLDEYIKSPINSPMPRPLELYLAHLDRERKLKHPATFTMVVKKAKEHGIRVIAIDSEATYQLGVENSFGQMDNKDNDRIKAMNIAMLERYNEYNDGEKFLVFVGSAHVSTYLNVPGVSDLLGCPNIVIHDAANEQQATVKQDVEYTAEGENLNFDILYERHSTSFIDALNSYILSRWNSAAQDKQLPLKSMVEIERIKDTGELFAFADSYFHKLSKFFGGYSAKDKITAALKLRSLLEAKNENESNKIIKTITQKDLDVLNDGALGRCINKFQDSLPKKFLKMFKEHKTENISNWLQIKASK